MKKLSQSSYLKLLERFLPLVALGLFGWMSYLTITLPSSYRAQNWDVAWIGFDTAMLVSIVITAWSIRKRRQLAIPAAMVSATFFIIDSWFDVMTSRPGLDFRISLATALLGEIPLAFLLVNFSRRSIRRSLINAHRQAGSEIVSTSLARVPLAIFDDE
jgi:hypothetical protein